MTRSKTKKLIRLSRSVHRWLGLVSLPLVMIIGITGYYLNHSTLVSSILPYSEDRGDMFTSPHPDGPREMAHLLVLMSTVWGRVPVHSIRTVDCDGFECLTVSQVDDSRRRISLGVESGDYIVRSRYLKVSRARDGSLISFTIYWDSLLDRLHTGDVARGKYRVLWDALCLALILLSLTGMVLWLAPTLRRERRKQE